MMTELMALFQRKGSRWNVPWCSYPLQLRNTVRSPTKKAHSWSGALPLANIRSLLQDGERHAWRSEAGIEEQSIVPFFCFPRWEDVFCWHSWPTDSVHAAAIGFGLCWWMAITLTARSMS